MPVHCAVRRADTNRGSLAVWVIFRRSCEGAGSVRQTASNEIFSQLRRPIISNKRYIPKAVLVIASIMTACAVPTARPAVGTVGATEANKATEPAKDLGTANGAVAALITLVKQYVTSGGITGNTENGLLAKLNTIQDKVTRGDTTPAANDLQAFIIEVEARRGKTIAEAAANELIAKAQAIIATI